MRQNFSEEVFLMIAIGTFIIVLLVLIILFAFITNQKRKFLHLKKIEALHNDYNREILMSRIEMKEETLKSVASELHDNVGHMITIGLMNLNLLPVLQEENDETRLYEARDQLNRALDSLRDIARNMNSDILLEGGLTKAIDMQLGRLRKSSFYKVEFVAEGNEPLLKDKQHALIIFRIIQESISNIIRHSKAREIKINTNNNRDIFSVVITDNGNGFNVQQTLNNPDKGSGLHNIMTRAGLINAVFTITSSATGTTSTLTYPLNQ